MTHRKRGIRLLLADDSSPVRVEIARNLRAITGVAELLDVGSVAEAREALFEPGRFDACILDFYLGDGTALDILRDPSLAVITPCPMLIVFTALPSPSIGKACRDAGAHHFFRKPGQMRELRAVIAGLAGARRIHHR